jgi:hypothetical protein
MSRAKLDAIIKKYDINLDELLVELNFNKEKDKEERQIREEKSKREMEEYDKNLKKKDELSIMKWNILTLEDRENVKNIHYNRYVEEQQRDNEQSIRESDDMEKKFEKDSRGGIIKRINENTLCVRGVNVITGWFSKIKSREEYEIPDEYIAKYYCNQQLINELYEAEMFSQGFEKEEDGDFYKTIIVKKKIKK